MLNSVISNGLTLSGFLICIFSSLVLGMLTALLFGAKKRFSTSLTLALILMPPVVALVIILINGNIGTGLAVAGTFALVKFRSMPGTAREMTGLFFAVAMGLACGSGYVLAAAMFFVIIAIFLFVLDRLNVLQGNDERMLRICIPENLDFDGLFDDLFQQYTLEHELVRVRTTNMGTLYELSYLVRLKGKNIDKEFIDQLRCRNGNLSISCGKELNGESL